MAARFAGDYVAGDYRCQWHCVNGKVVVAVTAPAPEFNHEVVVEFGGRRSGRVAGSLRCKVLLAQKDGGLSQGQTTKFADVRGEMFEALTPKRIKTLVDADALVVHSMRVL